MKKALLFLVSMALLPLLAHAQFEFQGEFPEADTLEGSNHGLAVDGEGKVWAHSFYGSGTLERDGETAVVNLRVFHSDGTEADFSPVQEVVLDDTTFVFAGSAGRGIRATGNGDIIYAHGTTLVLIDHQTGEGIAIANPETGSSLTNPASDAAGNIYVGPIGPGSIVQYSPDLSERDVIITGVPSVGRSIEVSPDGLTIYAPRIDLFNMLVYSRPNVLAPWPTEPDTVLTDSFIEALAVHPQNGQVWLSGANARQGEEITDNFTPGVWYGFDTNTWEKVDSVAWQYPGEDPFGADPEIIPGDQFHRGIAFNNEGTELYIGAHRDAGLPFPPVQKFTGSTAVSIDGTELETPSGYTLDQNYPNPFNPTTNIEFTLGQGGETTLKVYDISGREVASILSGQQLNAGSHTYTFDASNLSSGIYFYRLNSNGVQITRKMTLVK